MGIIIVLISISITIALVFLGIFIWVLRTGQYDDTYTPSVRMLFDHEKKNTAETKATDTPENKKP